MTTAVGADGQSDTTRCVQLSDQTAVENEPQSTYSRKPISTVDRYSLQSNDTLSVLGTRYYSLHGGIRYFLIESLSVPHLLETEIYKNIRQYAHCDRKQVSVRTKRYPIAKCDAN